MHKMIPRDRSLSKTTCIFMILSEEPANQRQASSKSGRRRRLAPNDSAPPPRWLHSRLQSCLCGARNNHGRVSWFFNFAEKLPDVFRSWLSEHVDPQSRNGQCSAARAVALISHPAVHFNLGKSLDQHTWQGNIRI